MVKENRTIKYLLYAMGEVVLVVIGVIKALEVSNINEEAKKEKLGESYILALQTDLAADVTLLEKQIKSGKELSQAIQSYIQTE